MGSTKGDVRYTKEFKYNALKHFSISGKSVEESSRDLGIKPTTLRYWIGSSWGQLLVAQYKLEHGQELMAKTAISMDKVIDTKLEQFEMQVQVVKDLERLMGVCIDRFDELLPKTKKIRDVTEAFDSISNVYIKIITGNKDNNKDNKEDKDSFIINLIDKQMNVRPIQLQEMLKE
jgi:transposase-like protein